MTTKIKNLLVLVFFLFFTVSTAQEEVQELRKILSFKEYLGYVKKHHPLVKQANLELSIGEVNLLKARGGFDPKIEVDYDRKKFKETEYFDQLNATFKIPTWYGIEFKANFEENSGEFLNPDLTVPEDGLYSAGVSFSLAQGFLINERMAMLKKAKFYVSQTSAQRELLVNNLIFEASKAYFKWLEASNELKIYSSFLTNAEIRFSGVKRNVEVGEKPAIDSIEAKIIVKNRKLNLEAARLTMRKAKLKVSNYLWVNNVPLEVQHNVVPIIPEDEVLSLYFKKANTESVLMNHPKLRSLEAKKNVIKVDRSLYRNKLLPKLDVQYNFLAQDATRLNNFNASNYKAFANFSFPLFLRKERGNLKMASIKLQDINLETVSASQGIQNKIDATIAEINSLEVQKNIVVGMVTDYETMLIAEDRKFELGESSLFLINSREQKLIEVKLKANAITVKLLNANASMYNAMGVSNAAIN
ncbi:TolC family protein [uncultured Maribacter sp.]|uniref:TolC family protein n=1 Tax=uncultured Maribacter sp. TaxID=431308 RepID=UPI002631385C|nr:TolC family protein [uncultured Maribacter sp.]